MKQSTRIVNRTKNTLKVLAKETVQSIQQIKQDKILTNNWKVTRSTITRFTIELNGNIILQQVRLDPRSGSRTMNGSRIKVGIIGDLQPGLNSEIFKVEISTGKPVASQQEVIPTKSFLLFRQLFFACRQLSAPRQSTEGVNRTPSHIARTDTNTLSAHHVALIHFTTSVAQDSRLKMFELCPK